MMARCFLLGMVQAPCFCLAIPVIGLRFGNSHAEQYINKKKPNTRYINQIFSNLTSLSGYQDSNLGPPAPKPMFKSM